MQFAVSLTGSCLKFLQRYRSTSIRAMITRIPTIAITTVRGANAPCLRWGRLGKWVGINAPLAPLLLSEPTLRLSLGKRYACADCVLYENRLFQSSRNIGSCANFSICDNSRTLGRFPSPRTHCEVARGTPGESGLDSRIYRLMARRSVLRSLPRRTRSPRS
jgi:hypothetical protein